MKRKSTKKFVDSIFLKKKHNNFLRLEYYWNGIKNYFLISGFCRLIDKEGIEKSTLINIAID
jgi:hypothetical protein